MQVVKQAERINVGAAQLSSDETATLRTCERLIDDPSPARGAALRVIRDGRLYRSSHDTFEDYCRDRWQISKTEANRLIKAGEVFANLTPIGVTALPESHARELGHLSPDEQRAVYQVVKSTAPDGKVTQAHLKTVATDIMQAGAIDDGTGEMVAWDALPPERKLALVQTNVSEETFERHQRQQQHIRDNIAAKATTHHDVRDRLLEAAGTVLGAVDVAIGCDAGEIVLAAGDAPACDWVGRVLLVLPRQNGSELIARLLEQHRRGITTAAIVLARRADVRRKGVSAGIRSPSGVYVSTGGGCQSYNRPQLRVLCGRVHRTRPTSFCQHVRNVRAGSRARQREVMDVEDRAAMTEIESYV
jgi:hypothetical protein